MPQPGDEVGGDDRSGAPGLVDRELSGRESSKAAVFGVAVAVLDAGVGTVAGFEERELPARGVGGERLVAPPVVFLEQAQLRAGVRPLAADDDPGAGG